jgi:YfiH family protein
MTQSPSPTGAAPPAATEGGRGAPVLIQLGPAMVCFTGRDEGDMAITTDFGPDADERQRAVVDRPWTVLRQIHGADVAVVDEPGGASGEDGDAAVSKAPGVALAILTADCAPIAFASPEGVIGVAHAGWRGLVAGVIEETVAAMRTLGATSVYAALGPCIHAECYAFGTADLDEVAGRYGEVVRAETSRQEPALDLAQAVRVALQAAGAKLQWDADICTACSSDHWSWRARRDQQRQATVVWRP